MPVDTVCLGKGRLVAPKIQCHRSAIPISCWARPQGLTPLAINCHGSAVKTEEHSATILIAGPLWHKGVLPQAAIGNDPLGTMVVRKGWTKRYSLRACHG